MNDDSIRDQLLARDCTDLGRCHLIGAPTSVPGVHQSRAARAWTIGVLMLLPFALRSLWLLWWEKHHYGITYLHPIVGPAAMFVAAVLILPFELGARWLRAIRWVPTVGSVAAGALVALGVWEPTLAGRPPASNSWSVADVGAIAERVARRGWTFEDLVFHL